MSLYTHRMLPMMLRVFNKMFEQTTAHGRGLTLYALNAGLLFFATMLALDTLWKDGDQKAATMNLL
jgi:hypothetical protein